MAGRSVKTARSQTHCALDARRIAWQRLLRLVVDFLDGATGRQAAARKNEEAFDRIELTPRVLALSAGRCLAAGTLGQPFARSFGIAPMGMCELVRPDADRILARAARAHIIPLCVSSAASTTLEDMRLQAGRNVRFQLYVQGAPEAALGMMVQAARAGYETLLLTVDVPQVSRRLRDLRNGFTVPFRIGPRQLLKLAQHSRWRSWACRRQVDGTCCIARCHCSDLIQAGWHCRKTSRADEKRKSGSIIPGRKL